MGYDYLAQVFMPLVGLEPGTIKLHKWEHVAGCSTCNLLTSLMAWVVILGILYLNLYVKKYGESGR